MFSSLLLARPAHAGVLTISWDPNTEPNVTGYIVSIGTSPGTYTQNVDVGNQTWFQFTEPNPSISYYFAVRAYTSTNVFSTYSIEVNSTPVSTPPPTVVTGAATVVSGTGASLNGSVNPNGSSTDSYFEYGLGTSYGSQTPLVPVGGGTTSTAIPPAGLSGLTCGTTYHFRAAASNIAGKSVGADATFQTTSCTTTQPPPTVTTGQAVSVSTTGATLSATATTNGVSTTVSFKYGLTTQYGSTTSGSTVSSSPASVAIAVSGLTCNTTYHFQAVGSYSGGVVSGADATFKTTSCATTQSPPTVTTGQAASISATGATLSLSVSTKVSTTVGFRYGLTTQYGSTTGTTSVSTGTSNVAKAISGLVCNTTYHYQAIATYSGGTVSGADAAFTTAACASTLPVITVQPKDGSISPGGSFTMSVQATSPTRMTYQWYVGRAGVTSSPIIGATSATFQTPQLWSTEIYWVRMFNAAGVTDSRQVTVQVR